MDFFMDKISSVLNKFGSKIPPLNIPWDKYTESMAVINPYIAKANILFPVDTALTILIIWGLIRVALLAIWIITFIRKMLPI